MNEITQKLIAVSDKIIQEKTSGILRFFGLLARADLSEKWDLLVSADWIEENNNQADLVYIIEKLKEEFAENLDFLSQIVILSPRESFIMRLAQALIREEILIPGEVSQLMISPDFTVSHVHIMKLDFTGIDLANVTPIESTHVTTLEREDF